MNSPENKVNNEWFDYYQKFDYFSHDKIREGCYPTMMEHEGADKAIVLVHGLTDSPYFMGAIAYHFHHNLGYNVYLPLLHFHGLKEPKGMEGVDLREWKANVRFAIKSAASKVNQVSIGGLSTGGTLSFYMACISPKINGDLYLFSAALDLAGGPLGVFGEIIERLLRTGVTEWLDRIDGKKPLIGENPYRYARIDKDGARELVRLIKETDDLLDEYDDKDPFPKRVFAAHSEFDHTADIQGILNLKKVTPPDRFTFFKIPKKLKVPHASLVLKENIETDISTKNKKVFEEANPSFNDMMEAITFFQK
ncbi:MULTISPECIES: alpha/beta hydrolase [unclassified Saccharicrinis]|uniref:alpha/beta hydrolase n=1 Tax=unclassified Saccharicrinis TaxID=2646859 RepID=UPI003D33C036